MDIIVWLLYTALLVLNFLDYATTHALLAHFRLKEEEEGPVPVWKRTRFGKWCIRHNLATEPEVRPVKWWEHELNPVGRWVLRKGDILGLAVFKGIAMGLIAGSLALNPLYEEIWGWNLMLFLMSLYVFVVGNNLGVMKRCRLAPFAEDNSS